MDGEGDLRSASLGTAKWEELFVKTIRIYRWRLSTLAGRRTGEGAVGSCMFIGGKPGTGKTASVMDVVRQLRREADGGEVPLFQFVEVNGLRLPTPKHAYTALYEVPPLPAGT